MILSRNGTACKYEKVSSFCSSTQASTRAAVSTSSHRYGSGTAVPCRVSTISSFAVTGYLPSNVGYLPRVLWLASVQEATQHTRMIKDNRGKVCMIRIFGFQ